MKYKEVISYFGGKAPTSRALGVTYQAVQDWQQKDRIPVGRQWQIQCISRGALKVREGDVACGGDT